METKPIKRNKNLVPLSKEHHAGLLFCWKIKNGLKKEVEYERLILYANWFWLNHLKAHQDEENEILFINKKDELVQIGLNDHEIISGLFEKISSGKELGNVVFEKLSTFMEKHIRFEERILFPHLEQTFTEEQLNHIGKILSTGRNRNANEHYDDEFWLN